MLYVNGCSLTYGMELGTVGYKLHQTELNSTENLYRMNHSWPGILSRLMNVQLINDAITGASNERIFRTTIDYIENCSVVPTYVVIGWTSLGRTEVYDLNTNKEEQITFRAGGIQTLQSHNRISKVLLDYTNFYIENFLNYDWMAKKLHPMVVSMQAYLRSKNINYIMFSAINNKMETRGLNHYLPDSFYGSVSEKYKIGPFLHPLEDGHNFWANRLFTEIIK